MALTIKDVEHVAMLARLSLTQHEKETFAAQLGTILEYASTINQLNTDGVEPLDHILPVFNVFREDKIEASAPREEILSNGPLVEDGQYRVPKIL